MVTVPLETVVVSHRCSLLACMQREQHFGLDSAGKAVLQENIPLDRVVYLEEAHESIFPIRRS